LAASLLPKHLAVATKAPQTGSQTHERSFRERRSYRWFSLDERLYHLLVPGSGVLHIERRMNSKITANISGDIQTLQAFIDVRGPAGRGQFDDAERSYGVVRVVPIASETHHQVAES